MVSPGVINHRFKSRATLCIGYFDSQYVSTFKTFVIRKLAPETAGVRPETFNYTGVCMYVCNIVQPSWIKLWLHSRVSDPDPQDPHVFGLPGSGSGSRQKGKEMNE